MRYRVADGIETEDFNPQEAGHKYVEEVSENSPDGTPPYCNGSLSGDFQLVWKGVIHYFFPQGVRPGTYLDPDSTVESGNQTLCNWFQGVSTAGNNQKRIRRRC